MPIRQIVTGGLGFADGTIYVPTRGYTPGAEVVAPASCGSDLLASGAAWLARMLPAVAGQPITYRRGDLAVGFCATFGRKRLLLSDELGGTRIEYADCDFIFPAASLVLGGVRVRPARGDVIQYDDGQDVHTYEVAPVGDEPPWRWLDQFHRAIRVHTQRLKQEPA